MDEMKAIHFLKSNSYSQISLLICALILVPLIRLDKGARAQAKQAQ